MMNAVQYLGKGTVPRDEVAADFFANKFKQSITVTETLQWTAGFQIYHLLKNF